MNKKILDISNILFAGLKMINLLISLVAGVKKK
jgi:hypothetical protein